MDTSCVGGICAKIQKMEKDNGRQFQDQALAPGEVQARLRLLEGERPQLHVKLAEMHGGRALAEAAASPVPFVAIDFDRVVNTSISKIRSRVALSQLPSSRPSRRSSKNLGSATRLTG